MRGTSGAGAATTTTGRGAAAIGGDRRRARGAAAVVPLPPLLQMMLLLALRRRSATTVAAWAVRGRGPASAPPLLAARSRSGSRLLATSPLPPAASSGDPGHREEPPGKSKAKSSGNTRSFKVVEEITDAHRARLSAAFDDLAQKEGFAASDAYFADDDTFEDPFDDDADDNDDDEVDVVNMEAFDPGDPVWDEYDDSDDPDAAEPTFVAESDDMEARIAAASRDIIGLVDETLVRSRKGGDTPENMKPLGFRIERNPFGNDETPRKQGYTVLTNAMTCPACGADFQCSSENRPGFLPVEKYDSQKKLGELEELMKLSEKASTADWTPEDEVDWLVQSMDRGTEATTAEGIDIEAAAADLGVDLDQLSSRKKTICKRCHRLQNFGTVDDALRPGWTDEPMLSQENFRRLLRPLSQKPAVIVALVDLFDFSGSVLPELDDIAGDNPVILVANKVDLLPAEMGRVRAENWVRRELEYYGIKSLANIGGAVQLVSCRTGVGIDKMLRKAKGLASDMACDVYLVGAANAGKSTLLNRILDSQKEDDAVPIKKRAGNQNSRKGAVTTSPLPGTTLKFIEVDLGDGIKLIDTPGLLVNGTLTQLLTPEELKVVVPQKKVEPITFRVSAGKCVLIGGLARIDLVGDSKPFLFTFYVANQIKLHPTDSSKAADFVRTHVGGLLTPPLPPGLERLDALGGFEEHLLNIEGAGWKEAAADISLTGLGWIAVTGAGQASVKVSVPKGIGVSLRPPLMPFDVWESTAKYTGGRSVRKVTKKASGKRRKGVGRS